MAILTVLSLLLAVSTARAETKAKRTALAAHSIALNMEFLEAQRAGVPEKDSAELFPQVWTWKKPAFTNMCSDFLSDDTLLTDAQKTNIDFVHWPGYFEAGNAVVITATEGFTAAQQALAALAYMETLNTTKVQLAFPDSAGCMKGGFTDMTLKDLFFRHMKWAGKSLAQKIIHTELDHSDFLILVGVSDSSTYGGKGEPSWMAPPTWQEKCFFGDMENPVADVAAQASTALALISRVLMRYGNPQEQALAGIWGAKASRAYEYSKQMWKKYGDKATCTFSEAADNCIGSGCLDPTKQTIRGPCILYANSKNAKQNLFAAASALFLLTEDANYRREADEFFDWTYGSYLYNWNNVAQQGVVILSAALDVKGSNFTRAMYRDMLRQTAKNWAGCSLNGTASYNGNTFCKATPDGSAYPLDMPWGNSGTIMNGMCSAAMYQFMGVDPPTHPVYKASSCFMRKQLGYFFNHKCTHTGSCNTGPSSEGFSYQVGIGKHWPTQMHTRDAGYPNFRAAGGLPDANTLCGAQVSGPYAVQETATSPVAAGTDIYFNDRTKWKESEPAVDYTASLMCATLGYAALPDEAFDDCDPKVRSPFTGRA